jgi:flagellar biosynthesis protein FlhG
MRDQADKLRQIIANLKNRAIPQIEPSKDMRRKNSRVITITSGKGGVGKSNIAVNLAISLSQYGFKVIIFDADFGLANVDVIFGIVPQYTLADVINDKKNILEVLTEGPQNIRFISGGSGVEKLVELDKGQLEKFVENIGFLDRFADFIIVDTGAGVSDNVMRFVMAADEVLVVANPEPTSITDAYALIKMISNRDNAKPIKIIVNRAENENEAQNLLKKLVLVSEKFLSVKLLPLGYLLNDDVVTKAVKSQQPFALEYPKSNAAKQIREIAKKLIQTKDEKSEGGVKSFMNKFISFLNK